MPTPYRRHYSFGQPLDDCWELIPDPGWTCDISPGAAHFHSTIAGNAEVFLRPCLIDDDIVEIGFVPGATRSGVFRFGFQVGFEYITCELNLTTGQTTIHTHEAHKKQPRISGKVATKFNNLRLIRQRDVLPGLPYAGAAITLLLDGQPAATVHQIDFLPESLFMFSLKGPGEYSLSHLTIAGPARPRPEFINLGVWKQDSKPSTAQNVDSLIEGVRQAAAAGVQILVTPETSLTGLRIGHPEMFDKRLTQRELERFQKAVNNISEAPYTLIGYPEYVSGREVEGAEIDEVMLNIHRFVRPDGTLGPRMAKVHVCEEGMWHGRGYNLQRVAGVEVAVGVCHDGHYQDVWSVGVMGGARICLHPANGGKLRGKIPDITSSYRGHGTAFDSFYAFVNGGGGGYINYPTTNRKVPDTLLAVTPDLRQDAPSYPEYKDLGDQLAHAKLRLYDASGCYPLRTLRAGKKAYETWSKLIPDVVEV